MITISKSGRPPDVRFSPKQTSPTAMIMSALCQKQTSDCRLSMSQAAKKDAAAKVPRKKNRPTEFYVGGPLVANG